MANLRYSYKALDTLTQFHRKKYVVFVEGENDEPFWSTLFEINEITDVHFKIVGGRKEISKYEKEILENDVNIVVARDSDYDHVFRASANHPRIICTYGYSIENTMYCPDNITKAVNIFSRAPKVRVPEVREWLANFVSAFDELVKYDLANEFYGKEVEVLGGNCMRFLESNRSHEPCSGCIERKVKDLEKLFSQNELDEISNLVSKSTRDLTFLIRGHFLSSAVANFIKNQSGLKSMSTEMLYGQMIALLPHARTNQDMMHLNEQIRELAA